MARLIAISGSLRKESFNGKLLALAVAEARKLGADVDVVEPADLQLPLYDHDVESTGVPPAVAALKDRMRNAQGFIIASPEYNYSIPGGLKNAIDWVSRPPAPPFKDKWVALMGASTGAYGTLRAQPHLRQVFGGMGMYLLPGQVLVGQAQAAFNPDGSFKEPLRLKLVSDLMADLVRRAAS